MLGQNDKQARAACRAYETVLLRFCLRSVGMPRFLCDAEELIWLCRRSKVRIIHDHREGEIVFKREEFGR